MATVFNSTIATTVKLTIVWKTVPGATSAFPFNQVSLPGGSHLGVTY